MKQPIQTIFPFDETNEHKRHSMIRQGIHPFLIEQYLTDSNGDLRYPHPEEWNEDMGLGYTNRVFWNLDKIYNKKENN